MADQPPTAAQILYPGMASEANPAATPPVAEQAMSPAAQALYGSSSTKVARLTATGGSPLGGQARPATLLGQPAVTQQPGTGKPTEGTAPAADAMPFNPDMIEIEGMQADPALMGEFSTAAKELGLDHTGAERLLQLHAKTQKQADAAMERQSQAWQQETLTALPEHEIRSVTRLLRDPSLTDPQLREWLESSPAGNWLPLIKTLSNWARAMRR
jgi:hypothetical protein